MLRLLSKDEQDEIQTKAHCCSFCGKGRHETRALIESHRACICTDCIILCYTIVFDREDSEEGLLDVFKKNGEVLKGDQLAEYLQGVKEADPAAYFKLLGYMKGLVKGLHKTGYLNADGELPDIPA